MQSELVRLEDDENAFKMKFWFLLFFGTTAIYSFGQQTDRSFADIVVIFKGLGSGGSTASLWFYSKAADTMSSVSRVQLSTQYLDTLIFLVAQVKPKRHFQQKVGSSFYASIIKDGQERRIAIVPGWGIIDLKKKKQYAFRGTPYFEIYNRFVDKTITDSAFSPLPHAVGIMIYVIAALS